MRVEILSKAGFSNPLKLKCGTWRMYKVHVFTSLRITAWLKIVRNSSILKAKKLLLIYLCKLNNFFLFTFNTCTIAI